MAGSGGLSEWSEGASVWFQPPGAAAPLPGELVEVHRAARVLLVSAHLNGQHYNKVTYEATSSQNVTVSHPIC
ncbi:hypothetical protein HW555_009742 [Spodoptera exigua]|uniref:Uncharacterized protein n=1 Tax=Spodoptera exigua TaxID=7107 RepID=A0A835GAG0_SPOEX|nr:hypothetical protein HW555_009742 [Spodoptera exigua]